MIPAGETAATARLTIDLAALADNWRMLAAMTEGECAAVVKADAYGIGIAEAGRALAAAGCRTFFVALPGEALALRTALGGHQPRIFVLSGAANAAMAAMIADAGAIPVLNSLQQVETWARHWRGAGTDPSAAIHVDTGMNRLGLTLKEAEILAAMNHRAHLFNPVLAMSHLACADTPDHPLNRQQLDSFRRVAAAFESVESSLANSAGIFLGKDFHGSLARPGIALYGGACLDGVANPMKPVVTAEVMVLQIRQAKAGETVSYGATPALARDTTIAIAGAGYADGLHRSISGSGVPLRTAVPQGGHGFASGKHIPVLGRVTMDLTLFDITDLPEGAVRAGDWIELFGPNIALDEAAASAGTIGYEMLTSLGRRHRRIYIDRD